jgi:rubredoxin
MDFLKNFKTYFKRIKKTVTDIEELDAIAAETKLYMIVSLALATILLAFSFIFFSLMWLFSTFAFISFGFCVYFILIMNLLKHARVNLINLTCDKCGSSLKRSESVTWEELGREEKVTSQGGTATAKLYVTLKISCTCPKCGTLKTFVVTLCVAQASAHSRGIDGRAYPAEKIVEDYFNGRIHV